MVSHQIQLSSRKKPKMTANWRSWKNPDVPETGGRMDGITRNIKRSASKIVCNFMRISYLRCPFRRITLQQPGKEDFHLSSKWDFHNDVVTGVAPVETPPERATLIFFSSLLPGILMGANFSSKMLTRCVNAQNCLGLTWGRWCHTKLHLIM